MPPAAPSSTTAFLKLNGHAIRFVTSAMESNARDKLRIMHKGAFHPWHWSSHLFPGLRALSALERDGVAREYEELDQIVDVEIPADGMVDIKRGLFEELMTSLANQDSDATINLSKWAQNLCKSSLDFQIEELMYLCYCFEVQLPPDITEVAEQIAEQRKIAHESGELNRDELSPEVRDFLHGT